MPIVGFQIKSIRMDRGEIPKGRIDINSTPSITSVRKSEVGFSNKEDALNIGFEFVTRYEPNIGEMKIVGNILYLGKDIKEVIKNWRKEKKLPREIDAEVRNFLFRKCMTIGINLSEEMQLPPPLMFPRVVVKEGEKSKKEVDLKYIG